MPLPTHQVYRLLTKLDDVDSLWTFRIFEDDSLQVEIECEGDSPTQQALTTAPTARDADQHLDNSYLTFDNRDHVVTRDQGLWNCRFPLVKRWHHTAAQYMECSLSPTLGVLWQTGGRLPRSLFGNVDHALNHPAAWTVAVEPVRATLYPLSCGSYTLKGVWMLPDIQVNSPVIMHIELLPGGQVAGTGFDSGMLGNPTAVDLTGSWTMDSLEVFQDFFGSQCRPDHLRFRLRGPVTPYVFQAEWAFENDEYLADDEYTVGWVGFADLRVTSMRRHWTPDVHHLFPAQFHEAVWYCLLSSLRRREQRMPTELWRNVFEFCDSQWFI